MFGSHPQLGRLLLREESSDIKIATEDTPGTEPWGRAPCPHPVPAAAEPHRGAQQTEQRGPRLPHISPGAAAAPSPSLALHGPGPCSELFTGQRPLPHGGVPVTVPAQSHLRWSCGGAQPGARARVSLGWSRDAHRASQMLLLRLFPLFLLSELQPRHPSSELRAGGSSAAAGRGGNKNKKARTKRESSYQLYQYPLEPVKGWDREGQFILRRRRAVPELFTARSEHDSKRECRIKPNENRGQLTRRGHCLPKPQVAELFH